MVWLLQNSKPTTMKYYLLLLSFVFFTTQLQASEQEPVLAYHLSMKEPHTHYFEVKMTIDKLTKDSIDIKMATWTPGSYLIREFARKVEDVQAYGNKDKQAALAIRKINKNTWRLYTQGIQNVSVKYKVYSYEFTVRTSFLDATHAFINGASVFMYLDEQLDLPSTLHIIPYEEWEVISTTLPLSNKKNKWIRKVENFDTLVDAPIEIGTHKTINFDAAHVPHELALIGGGNFNEKKLVNDMQKIIEESVKVFGEHPSENYTVFLHNTDKIYSGLEHANSLSIMYPRWKYEPYGKYVRWLGLFAHEYFHLWNVKRLRPKTLGPFNYEEENYTDLLWVSEGITSYYDDLILRRAGLISPEKYLRIVASNLTNLDNTPGRHVQSVADASMDAWIKKYRPDENFDNCCISYYLKGAVVGMLLDLEILHLTNGARSLDDVMSFMYDEYYKDKQTGFTAAEFQEAAELIAGHSLASFFDEYINGTKEIDYQQFFTNIGLQLVDVNEKSEDLTLGIGTKQQGGKLIIKSVKRETCGYTDGLNVNDELLAIDGYRVSSNQDIANVANTKNEGDEAEILVSRSGIVQKIKVNLTKDRTVKYAFKRIRYATPAQIALYKRWLALTPPPLAKTPALDTDNVVEK